MGSFNMTCFASNRTIANSNKVFIFPISQKSTYAPVKISLGELSFEQYGVAHSACYTDAFWGYAGPMIQAKYDDYGCVELTDSPANRANLVQFFNFLHANLFKVEQGENEFHDLAIDFQSSYTPGKEYSFQELTVLWNQVWMVGTKNRLFIKENKQARPLKFAMMHYKAAGFFENYVNTLKSNDEILDEKVDSFIQSKCAMLFKMLDHLNANPEEKDAKLEMMGFWTVMIFNMQGLHFGANFDGYDIYGDGLHLLDLIKEFKEKHPKASELNKATIAKIKQAIAIQLKHRKIHIGMEHYNVKLMPMTNGYQDYSNETGKNYLEFIQAVNGKVTKDGK